MYNVMWRIVMNKKLYYGIIALTALALAISFNIFSPYFKEVYDVTALQRGAIEFPRELPGVISVFIVAFLSFMGDIRLGILAQLLSMVGIWYLGFFTPIYGVMLVFLFINSLGFHLFGNIRKSIGIEIAGTENVATEVGKYDGIFMAFSMIGSGLAYIGFKTGFFSYQTNIKLPFIIASVLFLMVIVLLTILEKRMHFEKVRKVNFVFRKEYKYYYFLVILFGVQKQIMLVYGPWVLIELLSKGADTIAVITFVGSFIGMFFIPFIGRLIDRIGVKKVLYLDALSFIFVYVSYGLLVYGLVSGSIPKQGWLVFLAYTIVIIDKMSTQMGMVRVMYLKDILVKRTDLTPTMTLGMSMDHVVSILGAYLGGLIWVAFGAHYIFFGAAIISLLNVYIAKKVEV